MAELDDALWRLGINAKTEHNEVAPSQHELAPIFATTNMAVDQNLLIMEYMKLIADRHGMVCLLHEKPYAGVNGSGKHNNWSLTADDGTNLLDPGKTPWENTRFLLFLAAIIKAVDEYADLLRISVAYAGNDHRLGANEAPPAIISVFLGEELEGIVNALVDGTDYNRPGAATMNLGVPSVPTFRRDTTDRNRTSPFAFTGNKFEFRSLGSSQNIANSNTVISTIVAEAFCEAADILEKSDDFEHDVNCLIAENMRNHRRVLFNGNGYSEEWKQEAARRGLPNLPNMVSAIPALTTEKTVEMFEKFGVFTRAELESRSEVLYETYAKTTAIEAKTMLHMAGKHYIPAVVRYTARLADSICKVRAACPDADTTTQEQLLRETSALLARASEAEKRLDAAVQKMNGIDCVREMATFCRDEVVPAMHELRAPIDRLELIVDKAIWPVPTYGDLMFEV